jgi:hypothetical protein
MAEQPALTIPVPLYKRAEGRLSFLPAGHTDPVYMEVTSSRRIDIDYVNDIAAIVGVSSPITPLGLAIAGKSSMFGLTVTREPDRKIRYGGAAPDAPPPPSTDKQRKGRKKRAISNS